LDWIKNNSMNLTLGVIEYEKKEAARMQASQQVATVPESKANVLAVTV